MGSVPRVAVLATVVFGVAATAASAAVTPGWECVPTTAGQAVVSGGTGASPSCGAGSTAVLAPTFVSSGVGGKPTVQFSAVNVQIVSGAGSTNAAVNGEGNLVVGYAENASAFPRTGSNDLIVGRDNGWSSYGELVGGSLDRAEGPSAAVLGQHNIARGPESSVLGGDFNLASRAFSAVAGGCKNVAGTGSAISGSCAGNAQAVLGGFENTASGLEATVSGGEVSNASGGAASVSGGQFNSASGGGAAVAGGDENGASGSFSSILGGFGNSATTFDASVSGGESNTASGNGASVLGGDGNNASTNCQAIPAAPGSC